MAQNLITEYAQYANSMQNISGSSLTLAHDMYIAYQVSH